MPSLPVKTKRGLIYPQKRWFRRVRFVLYVDCFIFFEHFADKKTSIHDQRPLLWLAYCRTRQLHHRNLWFTEDSAKTDHGLNDMALRNEQAFGQ